MVIASELQSTESITRFLRNKDSQVDEIFEFVTKTLFASNQQQNGLYLPQKQKFILELLVDRITQANKQSQNFKFNRKTWKLLNLAWKSCETDSRLVNIRTNVLAKIRFGDTFSKLLTEFCTQKLFIDAELVQEMTCSMKNLLHINNTHLSDEQSVNILSCLLTFAIQKNYSIDLRINLVELAVDIFRLNNRGSLEYDSKHISEFVRSCLVQILLLSHNDELKSLKNNLKLMIMKVLFPEGKSGASVSIVSYIKQLLKATNKSMLQTENLLYLIQIIINKVKIEELEDTVKILIDEYPFSSAALIQEVSNLNKTLSMGFLSNLVEKALGAPTDESHQLIRYAMKRSSDITFKYANDICKYCAVQNENSSELFHELFDSYMRNREIEEFVNLWARLVQKYPNGIFSSDNVLDYIASKLVTVSYTQLAKLVESEVESYKLNSNKEPIFLLAVAKCFLMGVSGSIQNSLNRTLILNLHQLKPHLISLFHIEGEHSWKLKFFVANLFDLEDIKDNIQIVLDHPIINTDYFYFLHLRIMEQDIDNVDSNIIIKLKSYFLEDSDAGFKFLVFSRFFMSIERLYSKQDIKLMLKKLIDSDTRVETIIRNPIFQAQPQTISGVINICIENKKCYHLLRYISVYSFTKAQREMALDIALNRLNDECSGDIIKQLIQIPTYKSKLETEFNALLKLVSNDNMVYRHIAREIISLQSKRSPESEHYFQNLYDGITVPFENFNIENFSDYKNYIKITLLVLENHSSMKNTELIKIVTSQTMKLFAAPTNLTDESIVFLLNFMTKLNFLSMLEISSNSFKNIIGAISKEFKHNKAVEDALFGLICSVPDVYSAEYILALYIVLEIENTYYLEKYIEQISNDQGKHIEIWNNLSQSINHSNTEDLKKYLTLYGIFLKCTKKHEKHEYILQSHSFFVTSISNILTKLKETEGLTRDFLEFINSLKLVIATKSWLVTQYAVEQMLVLVCEVSMILTRRVEDKSSDIFVGLCQVMASIILYHRKRLSNRQHLVIGVLISLMRTLFIKSKQFPSECAASFERLMSNFCEPTINQISIKHTEHIVSKDDELNDALSSTKKILRKNIPTLVFNYIKLYLQYPLDLSMKSHIENSVYMMLDLLTLNELNYINQSLDNQGIVVFKTIYENYKQFYKWTEE